MKEERYYLALNDDELIVKVGKAPLKKFKVLERSECGAR